MEEQQNKEELKYWFNGKLYLSDRRRVACFGRILGKNLEIFKLFCAKNDNFKKKEAREVYNAYVKANFYSDNLVITINGKNYHPEILEIGIEDDNPQKTFEEFCLSSFYRKSQKWVKYSEDYLFGPMGTIELPKTAKRIKKL